jgi:hypothetical protein
MAAKTKVIQVLENIIGGLIVLGAFMMVAGAGLFIYVIFLRAPEIEEGGVLVGAAKLKPDEHSIELAVPGLADATQGQLRITFDYRTEFYSRARKTYLPDNSATIPVDSPEFRIWVRLSATDSNGRAVHQQTIALNWDNSRLPTSEAPVVAPLVQESVSGTMIYGTRPFPVDRQTQLTLRLELPDLPQGNLSSPVDDAATNLGEVTRAELAYFRDVADTQAYREFNAEAPTWGLYGGLAGLVMVILGLIALAKMPIPPAPPKS